MRSLLLALAVAVLALPSSAQWSDDPTANLVVADAAGDQVQPKVVPTPDGGVYISWLGGAGFDVRIQKLDASGSETFVHNGILVADRSFSSTTDYDLAVDDAGNAVLAFRDDRGTGTQITATLVTPSGDQPWGASGVQLTNTSDFLANPKVAGTSDGASVIAWTQNAEVHLQKLDTASVPQWPSDVVLTAAQGSYIASDLHPDGTNVLLSLVNQTGTITAPKHLIAQKLDASGATLWGPVAVFNGGSLQIGNFPPFVPDGSGGGVFSWYDVSSGLQSRVQRIRGDGSEVFPHNGFAVATAPGRDRVGPDAVFDASTESIYVFWNEGLPPSTEGVYGQKFDAAGNRVWGDAGLEIAPLASDDITQVNAVLGPNSAFAFWSVAPSFGQNRLFGARASGDAGGTIDLTVDVATTPSGKSRLVTTNADDYAVLVWQDDRNGSDDIFAQNVNPDGTLGNETTASERNLPGASFYLSASPNPSAGRIQFSISSPRHAPATLSIYDLLGRRLHTVRVPAPDGLTTIPWDGVTDGGTLIPSGVYLARLRQDGQERVIRLTVMR